RIAGRRPTSRISGRNAAVGQTNRAAKQAQRLQSDLYQATRLLSATRKANGGRRRCLISCFQVSGFRFLVLGQDSGYPEPRNAQPETAAGLQPLGIVTIGAPTSHQVTDIAPGSQHPVAVLISEDVETGIHEFETPRCFKWDCKSVPKKSAQHTAVSDHDDSFPEMLLGNFVEIRDVPLNLLSHALSARDDITWTHSSVQSILFREFFPELGAIKPLKDT